MLFGVDETGRVGVIMGGATIGTTPIYYEL